MTATRMDELSALVLEHLTAGGVRTSVVDEVREELRNYREDVVTSSLYRIFQFAMDGVLRVHVATLGGTECTVETSLETTVKDLKEAIEVEMGIPMTQQGLFYGVCELKDSKLIATYRISPLSPSISLLRVCKHLLW